MCIYGLQKVLNITPLVYAMDEQAKIFAENLGCKVSSIKPHPNKHVTSVDILSKCVAEYLIILDADCWILDKSIFDKLLNAIKKSDIACAAHTGKFDIPYLFKRLKPIELFSALREAMRLYPKFFAAWALAPELRIDNLNSGCVVDLPFPYGGIALFKADAFQNINLPMWTHSADLLLGMHIFENSLKIADIGDFQFNKKIEYGYGIFHLAGPKPDKRIVSDYFNQYAEYLKKFR